MPKSKKQSTDKEKISFIKRMLAIKKVWLTAFAGFLLGILLILAIRFADYKPPARIHYHANFSIYINGQREALKGPIYYEETAACSAEEKMTPAERVHMHNNENDITHVHDRAVTWGDFFTNLGWFVGPNYIETLDNLYVNNDTSKLSIILNGQDLTGITGIANKVIGDRDRLLVSYGSENAAQVQSEFKSVATSAKQEDQSKDPASCGGQSQPSFKTRFKHLL